MPFERLYALFRLREIRCSGVLYRTERRAAARGRWGAMSTTNEVGGADVGAVGVNADLDGDLVARVRAGDPKAFDTVYVAYWSRLNAFARARVGDADDAEDIVQSMFVDLWRIHESWTVESSIAAYLFGAVRNRITDHWNRERLPIRYPEWMRRRGLAEGSVPVPQASSVGLDESGPAPVKVWVAATHARAMARRDRMLDRRARGHLSAVERRRAVVLPLPALAGVHGDHGAISGRVLRGVSRSGIRHRRDAAELRLAPPAGDRVAWHGALGDRAGVDTTRRADSRRGSEAAVLPVGWRWASTDRGADAIGERGRVRHPQPAHLSRASRGHRSQRGELRCDRAHTAGRGATGERARPVRRRRWPGGVQSDGPDRHGEARRVGQRVAVGRHAGGEREGWAGRRVLGRGGAGRASGGDPIRRGLRTAGAAHAGPGAGASDGAGDRVRWVYRDDAGVDGGERAGESSRRADQHDGTAPPVARHLGHAGPHQLSRQRRDG
jgi:RNA polymerase sigma factor (sigma-70 family)